MDKFKVKQKMIAMLLVGVPLWIGFRQGIAWASDPVKSPSKKPKVIYPEKTRLDFEGAQIEGELIRPGEFYFQHRKEEKMESLIQRRKNFHREMLRDAILSK